MADRHAESQKELEAEKKVLETEIARLKAQFWAMSDGLRTQIAQLQTDLEAERLHAKSRIEELEEKLMNSNPWDGESEKVRELEEELEAVRHRYEELGDGTSNKGWCNIM